MCPDTSKDTAAAAAAKIGEQGRFKSGNHCFRLNWLLVRDKNVKWQLLAAAAASPLMLSTKLSISVCLFLKRKEKCAAAALLIQKEKKVTERSDTVKMKDYYLVNEHDILNR